MAMPKDWYEVDNTSHDLMVTAASAVTQHRNSGIAPTLHAFLLVFSMVTNER